MATDEEEKIDAEDAADEADAKTDDVDAALADAPRDENPLTEEEALSQPAGDSIDKIIAEDKIDQAATPAMAAPYAPGLAPPAPAGAPARGAGPSEAAARDAVDRTYAADQRAAGAVARITPEITAHKEAEAAGHDIAQQKLEAQTKELEAQQLAQQAGTEKAHAIADEAEKKYQGFKFRDFFTDAQGHDRTLARIFSAFAVGLGGFAAGPNGRNQALENIHRAIDLDFKKQEHELNQQKTFAEWSKEGEKDLLGRHAQERQTLLIKQGKALDAAAEEAKAQILRNGGSIEEAQNDAGYIKLKAAAEAKREQGLMGLAHLETQRAMAELRRKQMHAAGPSGVSAMQDFVAAASALKPGEPITPEVVSLALKANLKKNDIATQVDKYRGSGAKAAAPGQKIDSDIDKRTVRLNGVPVGVASSPRNVAVLEKTLISYNDSEEALKDLLEHVKASPLNRLPVGDQYDRAVLAIAATTTANQSDATTKHEANTLKSAVVLNPDAIARTLAHVRERKNSYLKSLGPLPGSEGEASAAPAAPPRTAAAIQLKPDEIAGFQPIR